MKDPLQQIMSEIVPHIKGLIEEIDESCLPLILKYFTLFGPALDHKADKTDVISFYFENTDPNLLDQVSIDESRFSALSNSKKSNCRKNS